MKWRRLRFKCRGCATLGLADYSAETQFFHGPWYQDARGFLHNFIYCRACGVIHDTIGSYLALLLLCMRRVPSKVVMSYQPLSYQRLARIGNTDFIRMPWRKHPSLYTAMQEDGRLATDEEEEAPITFLNECLADDSFVVRREAVLALGAHGDDDLAETILIRALGDSHWAVRRWAATSLGRIGGPRAIAALDQLLLSETWEYLVRKAASEAREEIQKRFASSGGS